MHTAQVKATKHAFRDGKVVTMPLFPQQSEYAWESFIDRLDGELIPRQEKGAAPRPGAFPFLDGRRGTTLTSPCPESVAVGMQARKDAEKHRPAKSHLWVKRPYPLAPDAKKKKQGSDDEDDDYNESKHGGYDSYSDGD